MDGKILVDDLDADGLQRLIHLAKKKRKLLLQNSGIVPSTPTDDVNLETDEKDSKDENKKEFLIPKKQRKRRFTQLSIVPPSVENGNRFSILNNESQVMQDSQDTPSPEEKTATGTHNNNSTPIVLRGKSI